MITLVFEIKILADGILHLFGVPIASVGSGNALTLSSKVAKFTKIVRVRVV